MRTPRKRTVGGAEAKVMKLKIASMELGNYANAQVGAALAKGGGELLPDVIAGAGAVGN